jgi:hypothetical protein
MWFSENECILDVEKRRKDKKREINLMFTNFVAGNFFRV